MCKGCTHSGGSALWPERALLARALHLRPLTSALSCAGAPRAERHLRDEHTRGRRRRGGLYMVRRRRPLRAGFTSASQPSLHPTLTPLSSHPHLTLTQPHSSPISQVQLQQALREEAAAASRRAARKGQGRQRGKQAACWRRGREQCLLRRVLSAGVGHAMERGGGGG